MNVFTLSVIQVYTPGGTVHKEKLHRNTVNVYTEMMAMGL